MTFFAQLIMSRSIWKGPFSLLVNENRGSPLLETKKFKKIVHVWSRESMILPQYVGKEFKIHNGKDLILKKIVEEMVGHKFGEFSSTKRKTLHKLNKLKQTSRKK